MVADSADSLKRNRGRRGLDILQRIQKIATLEIRIVEEDFPQIREVDLKLIELAKVYGCKIVTNDFNLNKVAQLRGVEVLNINELANALKPIVLPGPRSANPIRIRRLQTSWNRSALRIERKASRPFQAKYRLPIFLAIAIGFFNQLSGINAILYYLNESSPKQASNKVSGDLQAVAIGATNLLFTMIAMSVIDRIGRKILLLVGAVGTAICAGRRARFFSSTS